MPKLKLTPAEAASIKRSRKRNELWNRAVTSVAAVIVRRRDKAKDPVEAAVLDTLLHDVKRMFK